MRATYFFASGLLLLGACDLLEEVGSTDPDVDTPPSYVGTYTGAADMKSEATGAVTSGMSVTLKVYYAGSGSANLYLSYPDFNGAYTVDGGFGVTDCAASTYMVCSGQTGTVLSKFTVSISGTQATLTVKVSKQNADGTYTAWRTFTGVVHKT